MTSDAKIGLLLGLVFIFIIAFIINGLPAIGGRLPDADETAMLQLDDNTLGLADNERQAQEVMSWSQLFEEEEEVEAFQPAVESAPPANEDWNAATADSTEVRSIIPLPSIESIMTGLRDGLENAARSAVQASQTVLTQQDQAEERTIAAETTVPATSRLATGTPRVYEVQQDDVLATVAKKVYGPEEGNRLVNIQRIFEANRRTLESPDEIFVGQKLLIPPLLASTAGSGRPDASLSGSDFETVEGVGRRVLNDLPERASDARWYVVQDGDSLWKIAAAQLGSGTRSEELTNLNSDILKNPNNLQVGQKIRLPAR
jgi:nucleoid-associated protein YgaU